MITDTLTKQSPAMKNGYESELNDWIKLEKAAIELISIIGNLWFEKSIELILFHNELTDRSSSELLNLHLYAKNVVKQPISILDTLLVAREIQKLDLSPSRIDIGKLGDVLAGPMERLRTYYYHCMPFQSDPPTDEERQRFSGMDKFIYSLKKQPRFQFRQGKLQKIGNEFRQKRVDIWMAVDLVRISSNRQVDQAII